MNNTSHDADKPEQVDLNDPAFDARVAAYFRAIVTTPPDSEMFWQRLAPRLDARASTETIMTSADIASSDTPALPNNATQRQAARPPRRTLSNLLAIAAVLAICISAFALFHQMNMAQPGRVSVIQRGELAWRRVRLPPGVVLANGEGDTMTNGSRTPIISGAVKDVPAPNATLQVTPSNGNVAYICQLAGQGNPRVWRTTDAGQHWSSLATLHVNTNPKACFLEFDRSDPLTVIATFARPLQNPAESGAAREITPYVLFDGASHWQPLRQDQLLGSLASWHGVYYGIKLATGATTAVDPNAKPQDQPQARLYESTDQMRTWRELNNAPLIAENIVTATKTKMIGPNGVVALWVQPNTGEILAQTFDGVLWRSRDHGQSWARILLPALPPTSELTPTPGETINEGGATDAIAFIQQPIGNQPFTLCALVLDQTTIAYNVAPLYCSTDSGQTWTRRPRTAVEWGNGRPATFELPQLMLSDGMLLAWDVRTLSVFPGNNPSAAAAHVIGTIPTPLNPDNIPGGEASPIPGGAVLWQSHDPQTLYVAVYHTPSAP